MLNTFFQGAKNFAGGVLITVLNICLKSNLQKVTSNTSKYSHY